MVCQKFIFKIHSGRLRKEKWNLSLPLSDARKNNEIISLADSQILRWIDELNGMTDSDEKAKEIRAEIRNLRKEPNNVKNRRKMKQLYADLDEIQFKSDYMCLIIDKEKDYFRACKGFSINGVKYERLLGTNGGIKNSTIVFVSERHADELKRRIDNGRNKEVPLVPAKLEAYKALTCSASIPVSMPHGILVVDDLTTHFNSDVIYLSDEGDGEPVMEYRKDFPVKLDASDGCGMMLPSLSERWSSELGLDYMVAGVNTRFSFEKGMVFTFDFLDFAENVAHNYIVKDVWGNKVDVRDVEIILPASMVKLWSSYASCEDYVNCCIENKYTFGVAKTCPKELESERNLNYQFIQSYDLSDEDIEELIAPTLNEIKGVLGGDWRKSLLFLKGTSLNSRMVASMDDDFIKAIMAEPAVIQDPYIQNNIYQLIKNRINQAKVGVLRVHGNYSILSGDPYAQCQNIFGLPITGLLKAGEIYNRYWGKIGAKELACFRAPMTCHNNIRRVYPNNSPKASYWYRYMNTCTIFNAWDTACAALNGCDFDGDLVMLTDNNVLVRRLKDLPALMCIQRKAEMKIPNVEDLIQANINSFGNDIGKTTNWITSMFDVRAKFPEESIEYKILSYRIRCGQLYQQNTIDKAKGIISKPMPKYWHDRHSVNIMESDDKDLQRHIVADKKPYFMKYIYPDLMRQYNTYIRNTERNALREFQMTIPEMEALPSRELTERQQDFLRYYRKRMPVGVHDCVMNRICRRFEQEFDGYLGRHNSETDFDYTIFKSGVEYSKSQYNSVLHLYNNFNKQMQSYKLFAYYDGVSEDDSSASIKIIRDEFERECMDVCQNGETLVDILLDLCYRRSNTKRFVWEMCRHEIVSNLLKRSEGIIRYPELDKYGDIEYCGDRFSIRELNLGVSNESSNE